MPGLRVEKLSVGSSVATFYLGYHLVPQPVNNPTTDSPVRILIDVSKFGLTDANYFLFHTI
jgi:hypothetical protein